MFEELAMSVVSTHVRPETSLEARQSVGGTALTGLLQVVADPVFILAPPRSFTSVIGTMVGQHPQLYGLAETKLLAYKNMAAWWHACVERSGGALGDGL